MPTIRSWETPQHLPFVTFTENDCISKAEMRQLCQKSRQGVHVAIGQKYPVNPQIYHSVVVV